MSYPTEDDGYMQPDFLPSASYTALLRKPEDFTEFAPTTNPNAKPINTNLTQNPSPNRTPKQKANYKPNSLSEEILPEQQLMSEYQPKITVSKGENGPDDKFPHQVSRSLGGS